MQLPKERRAALPQRKQPPRAAFLVPGHGAAPRGGTARHGNTKQHSTARHGPPRGTLHGAVPLLAAPPPEGCTARAAPRLFRNSDTQQLRSKRYRPSPVTGPYYFDHYTSVTLAAERKRPIKYAPIGNALPGAGSAFCVRNRGGPGAVGRAELGAGPPTGRGPAGRPPPRPARKARSSAAAPVVWTGPPGLGP